MYVVWDKHANRPYSKSAYGHFKVYANRKAAMAYIHRNGLATYFIFDENDKATKVKSDRFEVRKISHIPFTDGGFY